MRVQPMIAIETCPERAALVRLLVFKMGAHPVVGLLVRPDYTVTFDATEQRAHGHLQHFFNVEAYPVAVKLDLTDVRLEPHLP